MGISANFKSTLKLLAETHSQVPTNSLLASISRTHSSSTLVVFLKNKLNFENKNIFKIIQKNLTQKFLRRISRNTRQNPRDNAIQSFRRLEPIQSWSPTSRRLPRSRPRSKLSWTTTFLNFFFVFERTN